MELVLQHTLSGYFPTFKHVKTPELNKFCIAKLLEPVQPGQSGAVTAKLSAVRKRSTSFSGRTSAEVSREERYRVQKETVYAEPADWSQINPSPTAVKLPQDGRFC